MGTVLGGGGMSPIIIALAVVGLVAIAAYFFLRR